MTDISEIIDLYAALPTFHEDYSSIIQNIPRSVIDESWKSLTARKRKPMTAIEASSKNPEIEKLLRHKVKKI